MVEKQMEEVMMDDLVGEKTESERKQILKSLKKYEVSDDFKKLIDFCSEAQISLLDDIYSELESRETVTLEYSQITEKQMCKGVLEKCAELVTNEYFKNWLLERADIHRSFIENFSGEELLYTHLDLLKIQRQEYHDIANTGVNKKGVPLGYLSHCINNFDTEDKSETNPHQPYED